MVSDYAIDDATYVPLSVHSCINEMRTQKYESEHRNSAVSSPATPIVAWLHNCDKVPKRGFPNISKRRLRLGSPRTVFFDFVYFGSYFRVHIDLSLTPFSCSTGKVCDVLTWVDSLCGRRSTRDLACCYESASDLGFFSTLSLIIGNQMQVLPSVALLLQSRAHSSTIRNNGAGRNFHK